MNMIGKQYQMKQRISMRNYKEIGTFFSILLLFTPFYMGMIFFLPLFGDATIHGSLTKEILSKGVSQTVTTYPLLYNIFQSILYSIFGDKGMNLIVVLGFILILTSIFLLAKEITGKAAIGFLSMIIVSASPKLIFYSARMYMEILLAGFFIFTIFLLMRFVKTKSSESLILLAIFTAITASIKQQGLFILFPSILFFLLLYLMMNNKRYKKKIVTIQSIKHIAIFLLIFIILVSPIYLALFHSAGRIMPGNEDYKVIKLTNQIGQKISGYQEPIKNIEFDAKYAQRLEDIQNEMHSVGGTRAESRHIFATDVLTSLDKSTKVHGLYLEKFAGGFTNKGLSSIMNTLMFFGLILFILNIISKDKILKFGNEPIQKHFLIFLLIFLGNNYILFARNTDQMRYHLFIAILFSIFSAIGIYFISRNVIGRLNVNKSLKLVSISLIFIILFTQLLTITALDSEFNKRWGSSQIYSPSKGGIASIQEVGGWINNHTNEDDLIWQVSGNELAYYSGRKVAGTYLYYSLNESELSDIFVDQGVSYIVIFDSQIVPDDKWTHFGWVPRSFENRIKKLYPVAYTSSYNDIEVYEVT